MDGERTMERAVMALIVAAAWLAVFAYWTMT